MANRVRRPGETDNESRKRTMDDARTQWHQPGSESLKLEWKAKAVAMNQLIGHKQKSIAPHRQHTLPLAVLEPSNLVMDLQPFRVPNSGSSHSASRVRGFGPCGLGDANWALQQRIVNDVDSSGPGFVRQYSAKWKDRAGGIVSAGKPLSASTEHVCCQEALGFCANDISDWPSYKHILTQLRQYVANHRRLHLVKGKNQGPNLEHQHPLLVLQAPTDGLSESSQWPKFLNSNETKLIETQNSRHKT